MSRKINDKLLLEKHHAGASGLELADLFQCSPAAISKRLKRLTGPPSALDSLTPKERAFCKQVASGLAPTAAIMNSHDVTSRDSGKTLAKRLMDSPEIQAGIAELMDRHGLTRDYRVGKLKEHCDNPDPGTSLKALDMSFKLADDFPAARSVSVSVLAVCPVDLSRYQR